MAEPGSSSSAGGALIPIKVKTMEPQTYELEVPPQLAVSALKAELAGITSIPPERQRLIYKGRVVRDDQTLSELGVAAGHTIHLVERPADAPAAGGAATSAAGAAAAGPAANAMPGGDFGTFLQGMFSALGGGAGMVPGPAGVPGAPPGAPGIPSIAGQHLLQSIAGLLGRLEEPSAQLPPMRVFSLDLRGRAGQEEAYRALTQAAEQVLSGVQLPPDLQSLLDQATANPAGPASRTEPAAATAGGGAAASAASSYPYLPLAMAALGQLLQRTHTYLDTRLSPGLAQAGAALMDQAVAAAAAPEGQAPPQLQQVSAEQARRVAGLLHGAAALVVDLARAAAAGAHAADGNPAALTSNAAAVIDAVTPGGPTPALPELLPTLGMVLHPGAARGAAAAAAAAGQAAAAPGAAGAPGAGGGFQDLLGGLLSAIPGAQVAVGPTTTWQARGPDGSTTMGGTSGSLTLNFGQLAGPEGLGGLVQNLAAAGAGIPVGGPPGAPGAAGGADAVPGGGGGAGARQAMGPGEGAAPGLTPADAAMAWQIASAVMAALGPVVQSVADQAVLRIGEARRQLTEAQLQEHAQLVSRVVGDGIAQVLTAAGGALHSNLGQIEEGLQQVQQAAGRQASLVEIARVLQRTFAPRLEPLGDLLGQFAQVLAEQQQQQGGGAAAAAAAAGSGPRGGAGWGSGGAAPAAAAAAGAAADAAAAAAGAATAAAAAATRAASAAGAAQAASGAGAAPAAAAAAPGGEPGPSAPGAAAAAARGRSGSQAAAGEAGPSSSSGEAGAAAGPRGLGLGGSGGGGSSSKGPALPAKRKAAAAPPGSGPAAPPRPTGPSQGGPAAAAEGGAGAAAGAARSAAGSREVGGAAPPPDLSALMQMMGSVLGGGAGAAPGGPGTAAAARGGAATAGATPAAAGAGSRAPGSAAVQPRPQAPAGGAGGSAGGDGGDLSGLMQLMGGLLGGGGGSSTGGTGGGANPMGGLLQMAGQIASDPAMQPLLSNVASAVLGGGGGGAGGAAGGLGSLLSGLLGGPPPGGRGPGSRPAAVVTSMDVLETELPADVAEEWRRVIERDEEVQEQQAVDMAAPLSALYLAGEPPQRQNLLSQVASEPTGGSSRQ